MATPPFGEVAGVAAAAVSQALPRGLAEAARAAIAAADQALAAAGAVAPLKEKLAGLACHAGCSWCCHQVVGVTPAEQALLAEGLAALPETERSRMRTRIAEIAGRGRGLDQRQWWAARLPCPVLAEDGRCALHPVRPLPCRAYTSADALICRQSLEGMAVRIPVLAAQWGIYGHAQAGLAQALAAAGIDPGPVGLVDALVELG